MIVVPRVLTEQLRATEPALARRLGLEFARHILEACRQDVPDADVFGTLLESADAFLRGETSIDRLSEDWQRFRDVSVHELRPGHWGPAPGLPGEVGEVVRLAFMVACQ